MFSSSNLSPADGVGQSTRQLPSPSESQLPSPQQHQQSQDIYPWSVCHLSLLPPKLLRVSKNPPPSGPSPSPFPRYCPALPATATAAGELFLFGGLVHESGSNDLYVFSTGPTGDLSATLLQTGRNVPSPRVGHAGALVNNFLLIWGGDTNVGRLEGLNEPRDDSLYRLDLDSLDWTRVATNGPRPVGRYGHVMAMVGSKLFVFGGQINAEFLDDMWAFEFKSLKPHWESYEPAPGNEKPPRRTGHASVTHGDHIIIFGGTDGQFHYNDTWSFDVSTRKWTELQCTGFIPSPREGHAAALVDDVMYVFGGRGVDGNDLGDLAACNLSTHRWFIFQNMGPSPSGRSGHVMASHGTRIFVLAGESSAGPQVDESTLTHVLDTKHIKYPTIESRCVPEESSYVGCWWNVCGLWKPKLRRHSGTRNA